MKTFSSFAAALIFLGGSVLPCPAEPAALTVSGLTPGDGNTFSYDAGVIDIVRVPHWQHTFTLKNDTKQPLVLAKARGSCGCETLRLLQGGAATPTVRLKPGEQAELEVVVALYSGQSGAVRKYVWVDGPTVAGQALILAALQLDMTLRQSVFFSPGRLDFGKVPADTGADRMLTVTADADLVSGLTLPPLTGSNGLVQATPVGAAQRVEDAGPARIRQTYQVRLSSSAPAGSVAGELRFGAPPLPNGDDSPLARVSLSLSGEVAGAIDALPSSIFFGSLPAGQPATRSVVLSAASPEIARSLRVSSAVPWLQATLDAWAAPARHRLLTVTLTKDAPLGDIQGKIQVTSASGDHLDVPVSAELTK